MAKNDTVFGIHAVTAVLKSTPQRIQQLYVAQGRRDNRLQKLLTQAEKQNLFIKTVAREQLDELVSGQHQGIIAVCSQGDTYDENYLNQLLENLETPPFLLILDGVTDPHNLGACLRTANAAGVHAVIAPKDNAVGVNATVRKVASGAAEVVPFIPVTNLARTLKNLQQRGIWISGTDEEGETDIFNADFKGPVAIVMGAEGKGLRKLTKETCDFLIRIPMFGEVSSLNVSVATGVCLYEALRQRKTT